MASTKDYLDYILDLLEDIPNISYKKMMGEYLLYSDGLLFGGIYDNRFLIKKSSSLNKYNLGEEIPYDGAKTMYMISSENKEEINVIINDLLSDLK